MSAPAVIILLWLLFSASHLPRQLREDPQVKDLIPKPVEVEVLLEKIRAHCG